MTVSAQYQLVCTVTETLADAFLSQSARSVIHTGLNIATNTLNAGTTPPATQVVSGSQALTAGAATIDLTTLTGTNGGAVSFSGLKVQLLIIKAKPDNANAITIGEGASDGYELLGNGWTVTLQPGQAIFLFGNDATPDVGGSAKDIDLAGTGTQGIDYLMVAG